MQHKNVPITHSRIPRTIWGPGYSDEPDYLRSCIKTLHKKIEDDSAHLEYIPGLDIASATPTQYRLPN